MLITMKYNYSYRAVDTWVSLVHCVHTLPTTVIPNLPPPPIILLPYTRPAPAPLQAFQCCWCITQIIRVSIWGICVAAL